MVRKYHNKKVEYDGYTFDSIREKNYYIKLKLLEKAEKIKELELQKEYELQPSFKLNNKTSRKITYRADFTYKTTEDDKLHVIDVKGFRTDVYRLKKKLFEYKYKIEIEEI
jgi:hypothetical protein